MSGKIVMTPEHYKNTQKMAKPCVGPMKLGGITIIEDPSLPDSMSPMWINDLGQPLYSPGTPLMYDDVSDTVKPINFSDDVHPMNQLHKYGHTVRIRAEDLVEEKLTMCDFQGHKWKVDFDNPFTTTKYESCRRCGKKKEEV